MYDAADAPTPEWQAQADAIVAALADLGMLKDDETTYLAHAWICHADEYREHGVPCKCPGGPELQWADWDELIPARHTIPPMRFCVHS